LFVVVAQDRFEHDANRNRQFGDGADAFFFELRQRVELALLAVAEIKTLERVEQL
jgi:hypothetical protein